MTGFGTSNQGKLQINLKVKLVFKENNPVPDLATCDNFPQNSIIISSCNFLVKLCHM